VKFSVRLPAVALCCFAAAFAVRGQSDSLPRHGVLGLQVSPSDATKPEDPAVNPPTIKVVAPGSAAEAAGFQSGDVLLSLDDAPVSSSVDFAHKVSRHLASASLKIRVRRGAEELTKTAVLKPRPFETTTLADVVYTSLSVDGVRRRLIVTKPQSPGRHPAVLLIGGLGCYSLDGILTAPTGYGPILSVLAQNNYVTMRVEKTGEGDSEGIPCTDPKATVDLEVRGLVASLRALKSYDFVDPTRVFVFAHSLGPLIGSLVIPHESVRGFIAAETIGRTWYEYSVENVRRQTALLGKKPDEVDSVVRDSAQCAYHFFIEHESAAAVSKRSSECVDMIRSYAGLPDAYLHQIGDISLGLQWKSVDIPVLVLYGTSDPATSADEGRYLADLINTHHPGRATYVELPRMGHDFALYDSQLEFLRRAADNKHHPYDDEVLTAIIKWLSDHLQS
jgi:pimeloyl-ACP methyl ester carboxylesterase